MIRNRSTRTLATLAVTVSLALAAFAGPATVLAARANADFGATAVLQDITPNGFVAYDVSFDLSEGETSNLAQLFLNATTPPGWDLVGIESGTGFAPAECIDTGLNLTCNFGGMTPADPAIEMRVVYQVGTATGEKIVHFNFTTSGVSGDKKGNSHGDDYDANDPINVEANPSIGGSYVQNAGDIVANDLNVGRRNPQSIKVTSPEADIPIFVGEEDNITACTLLHGNSCFGQASVINVNNGEFYGDAGEEGFKAEITYNANKPDATFLHFFDEPRLVDGVLVTFEEITDDCTFDAGEDAPNNAPCKDVDTAQGKTFATIWLLENGKTFGH